MGRIALLGVDAENGVFMLLYLDIACYATRDRGEMRSREQLRQAIVEGAVKRLCLRFMTVVVI